MDWNYRVGNFICQLRSEKGLTQKQLGERLGVTNKAVSKWENGSAVPRVSLIPKLAEVLGCTQEELFLGMRKAREQAVSPTGEYIEVIKRCDSCKHKVAYSWLGRKPCTCKNCGATLRWTEKSKLLVGVLTGVLFLLILFSCEFLCMTLTMDIFAGGFPSAEEAAVHVLLLKTYPQIKLLAYLAEAQILTLGFILAALLRHLIVSRLLINRLPLQVVKYPHIEDGKIVL